MAAIISLGFLSILPYKGMAEETYPTLYVKIHRVQAIDLGDESGGMEWYYEIKVNTGEGWQTETYDCPDGNDITIDETHSFKVYTREITIKIKLMEDDWWTGDDLADISGHIGGGADDDTTDRRGAIYYGYYDLKTDSLTGDETYLVGGYTVTSGDLDGSTEVDENDAAVYFKVWDNYDAPKADAGPDKIVQTGDLVNFDASDSYATGSSLTRYQWDFNYDGIFDAEGETTSYTYTKTRTYKVILKVTDSLGESDTDQCSITVGTTPPTAAFTYSPTNPSTSDTIQFTDTSMDPDGTIQSWSWNFGDGSTSNAKNPTHRYTDDGTYTVKLTVVDNDGGEDAESKSISVSNVAPKADFTYSPENPDISDTVSFNDKSSDSDGSIVSWSWDFGDGYGSKEKNPIHKYEEEGTYTVKLTVTDDDGATHTKTKDVTVGKSFWSFLTPLSSFLTSIEGIAIIVGAVIVVCLIVGIILWKKKRK